MLVTNKTSIGLKAHSLSCISHRQVHINYMYCRIGPFCNNTKKKKCTEFLKILCKRMSSMAIRKCQ